MATDEKQIQDIEDQLKDMSSSDTESANERMETSTTCYSIDDEVIQERLEEAKKVKNLMDSMDK